MNKRWAACRCKQFTGTGFFVVCAEEARELGQSIVQPTMSSAWGYLVTTIDSLAITYCRELAWATISARQRDQCYGFAFVAAKQQGTAMAGCRSRMPNVWTV
jgi:hypothetical protein